MPRVLSRSDTPSKKETARAKTNSKAQMVETRLNDLMSQELKPFTEEEVFKIQSLIDSDETTDEDYKDYYDQLADPTKWTEFKAYLAEVTLVDEPMKDDAADELDSEVNKLAGKMKSFPGAARRKTSRRVPQRRSRRSKKQTNFYKPPKHDVEDDYSDKSEEEGNISMTQQSLDTMIAAAVAKLVGSGIPLPPTTAPPTTAAPASTIAAPPPAPIVLLSPKEEEEIQNILSERCVTVGCILKKKIGFDICGPCHRRIREAPIRKLVKENNARNRAIERKEKDRLEKIALERLAAQTEARLKQPI